MAVKLLKNKYKIGQIINDCKVVSIEDLKDIQSQMIILKHEKTGARIIQVVADDKNNLFNIFLPTIPETSNGVAHILEHTTLCGSKKYPVRDSFFAMTKRSLNTFMNAMTGADFTCYPASSMVEKDYFNLLDIYLDAVFYPNLREMSFLQEGHRFEFENQEDPNSKLLYKGVVYNEMKGAMSNPQSILSYFINEKLYPTSVYGVNSGGDPLVIPTLTYEGLKKFHAQFYHPSNAIFFFYGDIPLEKNLQIINEKVLKVFNRGLQFKPLKKEVRFKKPISVKGYYPFDQKSETEYYSGISWLTCDNSDPVTLLGLDILVSILTDYDHSPLNIALIDSGLAVDLIDFSIDSDLNEISIAFGGKGVHKKNIKKVQRAIMQELETLVKKGIEQDFIDSAFHAIELQTRERKEPYGLSVSFKTLLPFQRGLDPKLLLQPDIILNEVSAKIKKGGFFEGLIKKWFLNNPHRIDFTFAPDTKYRAKEDKLVTEKLKSIHKKLTKEQKDKIISDAKALQAEQSAGDDPDNMKLLPCLTLKDIRKNVTKYPLKITKLDGVSFYSTDTATNGIAYLKLEFTVDHLTEEEKMLLPVLGNLMTSIGTKKHNFIEISKMMNLATGGINIYPVASVQVKDPDQVSTYFTVSGNAVYRNTEKLLQIIAELLFEPSFEDKKKVLEIVNQMKSDFHDKINPSGHTFASLHAGRNLTAIGYINNKWDGVDQLLFLEDYSKKLAKNYATESSKLLQLIEKIFLKNNLEIILSSEKKNIQTYQKLMKTWVKQLSNKPIKDIKIKPLEIKPVYEGLQINTNVAYVARLIPTVPYTHPDSAPLAVLARILGSNYTHTEIREKGGAYGGMANHNSMNGIFTFTSYRDPNINRTMDVYDQASAYVENGGISEEQVLEGILQSFSAIDMPSSPASKASIAHMMLKQGLDEKTRQTFRNRLLGVTLKQLKYVAKKYLENPPYISEVVISGKDMFKVANKELKKSNRKALRVSVLK